ncbi:MAG: reverse transcriptase/maturase family protein [Patescibacteria group bacterium]|jgi:retron-type reverse transcriptase
MGKIKFDNNYQDIISIENLLEAWKEFLLGKRSREDVQEFSLNLMNNIIYLYQDLKSLTYKHGSYQAFKINDPKPRDIHKASVRDRLLHHAIYRKLYPFFECTFIADSYSCRNNKGTHKAINKFRSYFYKASKNNTRTCWVLKCDIRKFFANIDHMVLINILREYISDQHIIKLLTKIINSFSSSRTGIGLPLGNLTSQLLVNIYMNEFDQFVKHKLKAKYYIRYADDFVILSADEQWLKRQIRTVQTFLYKELKLEIHPNKIFIKTFASGVDFLGMVNFADHRVLRTKTKNRIFKKMKDKKKMLENNIISEDNFNQGLQSYLGMLKHCNGYKIEQKLLKEFS